MVTRRWPITVPMLPILVAALYGISFADAQSAAPTLQSPPASTTHASKRVVRKPTTSKTANVRRGTIESIDPTIGKLALKSAAGISAEYELTEKTHYWKDRHTVDAAAFKRTDAVVVHLRHSRKTDTFQITELDDKSSWAWLDTMRHRTTPVILTAVDDDTLTVTVGIEKLPFTYAVNANTLWSRGGKAVQPVDFKVGDKVYVVPRALPGGDVQARAVADSVPAATQLKERAATSVHGTIKALNATAHTLTLITTARDTRTLICEAELEVLRGNKALAWNDLRAGQTVTARLRRDDDEKQVVWRITVQSHRAKTGSRKRGSTVKKI